jgi:aminoglycoside phosphotransferase (APT) family kinase protein
VARCLLDGEWVLRVPVTANAQRTLRRELALLEDLAPALSLPIPAIAHVARRDGQLLLAGYRAIRGEPLTHERTRALPAAAQHDILSSLAAFPFAEVRRRPALNPVQQLCAARARRRSR